MLTGDRSSFALEGEFTSRIGSFVYGRFRVWACGKPIGTFSEEVLTLESTTGRLRKPVHVAEDLPPIEFLARVYEAAYGDDDQYDDHRRFLWIFGCEGFDSVFSVIARIDDRVRIAWRSLDESWVEVCDIPAATYSDTCTQFLSWLESQR